MKNLIIILKQIFLKVLNFLLIKNYSTMIVQMMLVQFDLIYIYNPIVILNKYYNWFYDLKINYIIEKLY